MRDRKSVLLVLYDLPVATPEQQHRARLFRKQLLRSGYQLLQRSAYVKLLHNDSTATGEIEAVRQLAPDSGSISVIPMSLQTFRSMTVVRGEAFNQAVFCGDLVFL